MRRLSLAALLCLAAALCLAPTAQASFGLNSFDVFFERDGGAAATAAGTHPEAMRLSFGVNYTGEGLKAQPDGEFRDATLTFPAGLTANPSAAPRCSNADFLAAGGSTCPPETEIGESVVEFDEPGLFSFGKPIYNLVPPRGSPARFGFRVENAVPVVIDGAIEESAPFRLLGRVRNASQAVKVFGSEVILYGVPHPVGSPPAPGATPLLTLPTSCTGPVRTSYAALSWEAAGDAGSVLSHDAAGNPTGFSECGRPQFGPTISARPSTADAASSSGLDFSLGFDQQGLRSSNPGAVAQSTVKEAQVTLPAGMTANPSLAEGLGVCTPAELGRETLDSAPGEGCPDGSKIGTISVDTPLLEDPVSGAAYIAQPDDPATSTPGAENPFDSLLALYFVVKDPARGILLKLPAEVEPDPRTGQLTTTVKDAPQVPFTSFSFRFREGQRAPLITPPGCGAYTVHGSFTPWADPSASVSADAAFQITAGPEGRGCPPPGAPPFEPGFHAGTDNNAAASYSPFEMRITRRDGDQDLTKLSAALPPGVTGSLRGIAKCPDAAIALAKAKSGRAEQASPSCPQDSLIGHTVAGAGVGSALTYVRGSLYFAGPYHGAPLSVVAITPAVAGPFDAGTVVVRFALRIDPRTAQASVDGAASDPIPHILKGIPLSVRDLRASTDRPGFTLNPTSCAESRTAATLWGSFLDQINPADDVPVGRSSRFQAAGCAALDFSPHLAVRLYGGVKRGAFPALRAIVTPPPGQANFARAAVTLPHSAFLEQGHIRTICTRVQFAAGAGHGSQCPAGAVYGHAKAWTPLLDGPATGPVFLRSSNHNLPDLVVALHGPDSAPVDVELASRIDSVKGGIRSIFTAIPDLPVSRFVLAMQGGKKGLIVNSRNLCYKPKRNRARANLLGQNGRRQLTKPRVVSVKCAKLRKARHKRAKKSNRHHHLNKRG